MAKTNFTKAEEALADTLQKMTKESLLKQADAVKGKTAEPVSAAELKARTQLVHALQRELKRLHKADADIYKKLGIKKRSLEKWAAHLSEIGPKEWEAIQQAKEKVDRHVKELAAGSSDEQIVEQQRVKHINKRFNVSDKWLPLH